MQTTMTTKPAATQSFIPARSPLLQRKCACGNSAGLAGECSECQSKPFTRQRGSGERDDSTPLLHDLIQPKLTVGQSGNVYEQEADRVAEQVMRMPDSVLRMQRQSQDLDPEEELEEETALRLKPLAKLIKPWVQRRSARMPEVQPDLDGRLSASKGGGTPLPNDARSFMEPRFGRDFSQVRVHTDSNAVQMNQALQAQAFTHQNHIFFNAGKYAPNSEVGKTLLAHELTHVVQQRALSPISMLQRACDSALLATRTQPVFFPRQTSIAQVFNGTAVLHRGTSRAAAVGLVQQALVDLGYNLGTFGPNSDGVDKRFGSVTEQAVQQFQTDEAIAGAVSGSVDQPTLKCLDEVRSHRAVPSHLSGTVTDDQLQVIKGRTGGRDEDIFFARGDSALDVDDLAKIKRLATSHKGCALTLKGFISEDERIDFGDTLANDRLNAVDAALASEHHSDPGVCIPPVPALPLRTLIPQPAASEGVITYRSRRKVEVVTPTATSTTPNCCPIGVTPPPVGCEPQNRPLNATEMPIVTTAIDDGVAFVNHAISQLVPGNGDGDGALTTFFGSTSRRGSVRTKLQTWQRHLNRTVRTHSQRGTRCDSICASAIAYNEGVGSSAMMTVCGSLFNPTQTLYPGLSADQNRAIVVTHEAGHGALDTQDFAYDTNRLIRFIHNSPSLALENTDSFISLIRCLNGLLTNCTLPPSNDTSTNMSAIETQQAQEGLAWLESWLIWSGQDAGGAYSTINSSRARGTWTNSYYESVFYLLANAFNLRRPRRALPTMREQTAVAAIWDRYQMMERGAGQDLRIEKDTTASPVQRWEPGTVSPSDRVFLTAPYFSLGSARARVEMLLPMIVEASPLVSASLRPAYIKFVKDTIRQNWQNQP